MADRWQFWIDRGGTFTDLVAREPDGSLHIHKEPSEQPGDGDAALIGIRKLLDLPPGAPLPSDRIASIRMGTTVATNALLERRGTPTVFVTTEGHADVLRIGTQQRPDIFARHIVRPDPLYDVVVEVPERIAADGTVLRDLDEDTTRHHLQQAFGDGCRACAIALLHGYRFSDHEKRVAEIAGSIGFEQISTSHEVSPLLRIVPRGETTVVDAYVAPVLRRYIDRVEDSLGGVKLQIMQSNGGLADAEVVRGKDTLLSGPAGGIVGAVRACGEAGYDKLISFDMGGTSTDVAHYAGSLEREEEVTIEGATVRAPVLAIHTVAAGGGSVVDVVDGRYRVGPESAGAVPGPAAYGRGGPLTITDCNVLLGRVQPDYFPEVFGPGGDAPLDVQAAKDGFQALLQKTPNARSAEEMAEGFVDVATERMAQAIRKISLEKGHDIAGYTLCCFGGAGGQHACRMAEALDLDRILIHPCAGVLSAYGIGHADQRTVREQSIEEPLAGVSHRQLQKRAAALETDARRTVDVADAHDNLSVYHRARLRYDGTDTTLTVPLGPIGELRDAFTRAHQQRFGFVHENRPVTVAALEVEVIRRTPTAGLPRPDAAREGPPRPARTVRMFADGAWRDTSLYQREALQPGDKIAGPAIIAEATSTTVVEPGWNARVNASGHLVLTPGETSSGPARTASVNELPNPVQLALFHHRFQAIAEQMGTTLQQTAHSVNIRERLDFSCAVFDGEGQLVANAPHIPVHLGSMSASVQHVIASQAGKMAPGDAFVLNNPYRGGTHLPDVTVVSPVFLEDDTPTFFVASRGHHADIGGHTPGSMPPDSTHIDEEGVLIDCLPLVRGAKFQEDAWSSVLRAGRYPARNPAQNTADVQAQLAANAQGVQALEDLVEVHGREVATAYMQHMQDHAEAAVRRAIAHLEDGSFEVALDEGARIRAGIAVDREERSARIDFTGTSPQVPSNFNAPTAITQAAVLYVFRTLVDEDLPLNAGCLHPLEIVVPERSLLNPEHPAAVVAGNVDTSQLITDALYGALGVLAGSQGTMNNFTFGNDAHQYYETICGGTGAGPDHPGASAVHSHMTNSRLTAVEVLEARFPVRVERFEIRRGSGGEGRFSGGNGVRREIRFLEPMTAAIISSRRTTAPFGLQGGSDGAPGRNALIRADGTREALAGTAVVSVDAGDTFVIETPGGGGYGAPG